MSKRTRIDQAPLCEILRSLSQEYQSAEVALANWELATQRGNRESDSLGSLQPIVDRISKLDGTLRSCVRELSPGATRVPELSRQVTRVREQLRSLLERVEAATANAQAEMTALGRRLMPDHSRTRMRQAYAHPGTSTSTS